MIEKIHKRNRNIRKHSSEIIVQSQDFYRELLLYTNAMSNISVHAFSLHSIYKGSCLALLKHRAQGFYDSMIGRDHLIRWSVCCASPQSLFCGTSFTQEYKTSWGDADRHFITRTQHSGQKTIFLCPLLCSSTKVFSQKRVSAV